MYSHDVGFVFSPSCVALYKLTGDEKFLHAANSQLAITESCLIREDGSSFHHYQFDTKTHKPLYGCAFQGRTDESTWSRGQAWGVMGLPIAYSYNKDEDLLELHRDVTYFTLNHLPKHNIPYWDYDFVEECDEPLDVSAGLVSACGMLEATKYLPDSVSEKKNRTQRRGFFFTGAEGPHIASQSELLAHPSLWLRYRATHLFAKKYATGIFL